MNSSSELQSQLTDAIRVSENIVACLHSGDFEAAKQLDQERAEFIRALSKCRDLHKLMPAFVDQFKELSRLNESIISISRALRDDVLTEITAEQANRSRHKQYIQNQNL